MASAKAFVDSKISGKKVVVFSKTTCPFCDKVKKLFKGSEYNLGGEDYEVVELDKQSEMSAIQDYLLKLTGARSVSIIFTQNNIILFP